MDYAERSSCIEGRRISVRNDWVSGEAKDAEERGMSERIRPHMLIRIIEDSKITCEEESKLQKIKGKVEHDEHIFREDEVFLIKLNERANDWHKGGKSSSDTEQEDTTRD